MQEQLACNRVGISDGGQAVSHHNGGACFHETLQGFLHQVFTGIVQCARCLNVAPASSAITTITA